MKTIKLLSCLAGATIMGALVICFEAIMAIPLNVLMYIRDHLIPSYKEIWEEYTK